MIPLNELMWHKELLKVVNINASEEKIQALMCIFVEITIHHPGEFVRLPCFESLSHQDPLYRLR